MVILKFNLSSSFKNSILGAPRETKRMLSGMSKPMSSVSPGKTPSNVVEVKSIGKLCNFNVW